MIHFYHEQNESTVLWNPTMILLLSTSSLFIGVRAYFIESDSKDSLLLLQFAFNMLTMWRCLTIKPEHDAEAIKKISPVTLNMHGIVPLFITLLLGIVHLVCLVIGHLLIIQLDETNFMNTMLCVWVLGGKGGVRVTNARIICCCIDLVILLALIFFKLKYKLMFGHKEFRRLRKTYKKLNMSFKIIAYVILGYESLTNPLYIFIVYLALKQNISANQNKNSWTNASNLIGLMRYIAILSFFTTALKAPSYYFTLGNKFTELLISNDTFERGSLVNVVFFMVCHMCVYMHELCLILPKIVYRMPRTSQYPPLGEFEDSYFNQFLLGKWMRIMNPSHFALADNFYETNISTLKAYFHKDPLIRDHIERLKIKRETHKYKWLQRLLVTVDSF